MQATLPFLPLTKLTKVTKIDIHVLFLKSDFWFNQGFVCVFVWACVFFVYYGVFFFRSNMNGWSDTSQDTLSGKAKLSKHLTI